MQGGINISHMVKIWRENELKARFSDLAEPCGLHWRETFAFQTASFHIPAAAEQSWRWELEQGLATSTPWNRTAWLENGFLASWRRRAWGCCLMRSSMWPSPVHWQPKNPAVSWAPSQSRCSWKGRGSAPLLALLWWDPVAEMYPALGQPRKEGHGPVGPWRWSEGLAPSPVKTCRVLGLFNLEKGRFWEDLRAPSSA